ncbi:Sugar phosphatase YidA [Geodia barretti]|uniref:Sugar phosphatase YidA n=1 Tax=Geodia barretti TaxID=519541 RepID=A0AA35RKM5_GEOBA|nr:Sugar phosphatase YidA [Geodia barretti]
MVRRMSANPGLEAVKAYLPYNGLWSVNFNRRGVNKGSGLRALCGLLGIEPSEVAAVGDSFNDVAMFETAGLSIAMGGAPPELLKLAHHAVASVEQDGLVEAIERYVLPAS